MVPLSKYNTLKIKEIFGTLNENMSILISVRRYIPKPMVILLPGRLVPSKVN